jgi:branched-chain amino acid transport system substrate-binding protein
MALSRRSAVILMSAAGVAGVLTKAQAQQTSTIKVGVTAPLTGAGAEIGKLQVDGATLAVNQINAAGGVNGQKLELVVADDQTSNPGEILAFSRLAGRGDIVAVVSSVRSTQVKALSPDALRAGIPVFIGGTDPSLTHTGNPWLFRCRPSDTYSADVIASFGVNKLVHKKWAIVHTTDAFGEGGAKALTTALRGMGITPVLDQGFQSSQADLTPVVLAVRQSGADIIATYIAYETDVAQFARQLQQFGVHMPWIGSASVSSTTATNLAGPALYGTYSVADFSTDANAAAKAFAATFQKQYGRLPDYTSAWTYDSVLILAHAIKVAGSTDPAKLQASILGMQNYVGAEGTYSFDKIGDGLHGYNIVQNDNGKITYIQTINFEA